MTIEQKREIDIVTMKMFQKIMKRRLKGTNIANAKQDGIDGLLRMYLQLQNIIVASGYPIENYRVSPTTSDEIKNTLFLYGDQNRELLPVSPDANKLLSMKKEEILPFTMIKERKKPFFHQTQINQICEIESLEQMLALMLHYQLTSSEKKEYQQKITNEIKYYFPRTKNYRDRLTTIPNCYPSVFEWEHISKEERFESLEKTLLRSFQIDI